VPHLKKAVISTVGYLLFNANCFFMKKLLFLTAFMAFVSAGSAQNSSFGLKAGANFYIMKGEDYDDISARKTGFHGGMLYRIPLGSVFSLQPELLYSGEGVKLKSDDVTGNFNFNYLNVPLMLQVNAGGLYIETGPQVGFLLSAKGKITESGQTIDMDLKDEMNKVAFSWGAGLGYWFGNVGLGGRYNIGLSRLPKDAEEGKDKMNGFQASLLWRLRK
jgi:hypothetical protein